MGKVDLDTFSDKLYDKSLETLYGRSQITQEEQRELLKELLRIAISMGMELPEEEDE